MKFLRRYLLLTLALTLAGCTSSVPPVEADSPDPSPSPTASASESSEPETVPDEPEPTEPAPEPSASAQPSTPPHAPGPNANRDAAPKLADGRVDCSQAQCAALTFDDGPGKYTEQLLDTLKAAGVPVTFFMIGSSIEARPDTVKRAAAEGHALGTHTWSHPVLTKLSEAGMREEMSLPVNALNAIGLQTNMIRPPYGARNEIVDAVADSLGLAEVLWSVDTRDWESLSTPAVISEAVADAFPGSIILMHDVHPTTVAAVPDIITKLEAAGYVLVTVPELLGDSFGAGSTIFSQGQVKAH